MRDGYIYRIVFSVLPVLGATLTSVFVVLNVFGIIWWPTILLICPCLISTSLIVVYTIILHVVETSIGTYSTRRHR